MSCEHELKTLSEPVVDLELTIFGGRALHYPPIFQCTKCLKVFKTGYNEWELIEIPVKTVEELEKEQDEYEPIKRKISPFSFWMGIIIALSFFLILGILLLII